LPLGGTLTLLSACDYHRGAGGNRGATKKDYYQVLGVPRGASTEEIRKAYRRLAFQCHPDRNHEAGAEARFKEISEAYETLGDTRKRARYDQWDGFGNGRGFEGFDGFVSGLGDIFEAFFAGTAGPRGSRRVPREGADIDCRLFLSFQEAASGCEKEVEVLRAEACSACRGTCAEPGSDVAACPVCGGSGEVGRVQQTFFGRFVNRVVCQRCQGEGIVISKPCRGCQGSGIERRRCTLSVKVPAGVDSGSTIRLRGEGDVGMWGGPPGDLLVAVTVRDHEYFQRDGCDVLYELQLNFAQAALGYQADVPTLDGQVRLNIPAGTQSGEVFRLKDKGIPYLKRSGRGDQLVRVRLVTPEKLNREQRRLFEELGETFGAAQAPQKEGRGLFGRKKGSASSRSAGSDREAT